MAVGLDLQAGPVHTGKGEVDKKVAVQKVFDDVWFRRPDRLLNST